MARPVEIRKTSEGKSIKIRWQDGHESEYPASLLREQCRCAACRHELTGEKLIAPGSIPSDIKILKAEVVGNYALGFSFSDNHSTGIYPFDALEKLG